MGGGCVRLELDEIKNPSFTRQDNTALIHIVSFGLAAKNKFCRCHEKDDPEYQNTCQRRTAIV